MFEKHIVKYSLTNHSFEGINSMKFRNKNVLITGINGFVGSHLSKKLLEEESNVFGIVRNKKKKNENNNITYINGDLTDIDSLANAIDTAMPDYIFHLAAQSFVPESFQNPLNTEITNSIGTQNLLESMRVKDCDARMIFAGSSEEYGLVFSSYEQYKRALKKYKNITPGINPDNVNEIPISEDNPLRPMNPYAISKVHCDYLTRNYFHSYDLDTVVSRCFNHEGAGRGLMFVTSVITDQVSKINNEQIKHISIGNVNAFRDWSHINDTLNGYLKLALKASKGDVYNQGSMRCNSILSYILLSIEESGYNIDSIRTFNGDKKVSEPTLINNDEIFGVQFNKTKIDSMLLENDIDYSLKDKGIIVECGKKDFKINFDKNRFRQSDVPILLSDNRKIRKLGAEIEYTLNDIIKDQLDYFDKKNSKNRE